MEDIKNKNIVQRESKLLTVISHLKFANEAVLDKVIQILDEKCFPDEILPQIALDGVIYEFSDEEGKFTEIFEYSHEDCFRNLDITEPSHISKVIDKSGIKFYFKSEQLLHINHKDIELLSYLIG